MKQKGAFEQYQIEWVNLTNQGGTAEFTFRPYCYAVVTKGFYFFKEETLWNKIIK